MPKKKYFSNDPNQLSLVFKDQENDSNQSLNNKEDKLLTSQQKDNIVKQKNSNYKNRNDVYREGIIDLFLPLAYEDIPSKIGADKARLPDLIVPVVEFEKKIIQILANISTHGHLVFLYGASGVGKSTFTHSLQFRKHIPIQKIISINALKPLQKNIYITKLPGIIERIKLEAECFFEQNNKDNDKLCIIIEFLENLDDQEKSKAVSFFRDLNSLLRTYPILVIWPVTVKEDLDTMQEWAKSYSSSMFDRKYPFIHFTGPPLTEYPNIVKKTIEFFNAGKTCYDFQLNDNDFCKIKKAYDQKPIEKHLIREYFLEVKEIWEERSNYYQRIVDSIPKQTEVWFIFAYPEAEATVAQFAKTISVDEMWNAEFNPLQPYIRDNNQRSADWPQKRLTLALNTRMLTTKIMYLPTNALISSIVAYSEDAGIPISREEFLDKDLYDVPSHWFGRAHVRKTLSKTPLCLQLSGTEKPTGKRKSGKIEEALENARQAFNKINNMISSSNKGKLSDHNFNKALCMALKDILNDDKEFILRHEENHPYLNLRPDITVETNSKIICLELCYTVDKTPGYLADYVLRKLNAYMKQIESNYNLSPDTDLFESY